MEFVLMLLLDLRILNAGTETVTADFSNKDRCLRAAEQHIKAMGDLPLVYLDINNFTTWESEPKFAESNGDGSSQSFRVMAPVGRTPQPVAIFTCAPK